MEQDENATVDYDSLELSLCDLKILAEALAGETVREPDEFLRSVAREYNANVKSYLTGKI